MCSPRSNAQDIWEQVSPDRRPHFRALFVSLVLGAAADFDMRFVKKVREWPLKMFLLSFEKGESPCDTRRQVCQDRPFTQAV